MNVMESFKMAVGNIRTSKMRSFLTMLGIIIGVAAVIVIVGMGNGMEIYMTEQFESMGTNTLTVSIYGRGTGRTVTDEDMYDIVERNSDALELLSPTVTMQSPAKIGTDTITSTSITGVSEDYFTIKDYDVAMGRGLQYVDMLKRSRVCVVGTYLNQEYFGGNALGQTIKIGGTPFTVVGILNEIHGEPANTVAFDLLTSNRGRYETSCAMFRGLSRIDFVDRLECSGNVLEQIESAISFVKRNMHLRAVIKGLYREDVYEIPITALREAIVNAVVHRSYVSRDTVTVTGSSAVVCV